MKYFISYVEYRYKRLLFGSTVIDKHPFKWLKEAKEATNIYGKYRVELIGWKEITEEEYELLISLGLLEKVDEDG